MYNYMCHMIQLGISDLILNSDPNCVYMYIFKKRYIFYYVGSLNKNKE